MTIIITLFIFLIISLYVNWNLYRKVSLLEKYASDFLSDLVNLKNKIREANKIKIEKLRKLMESWNNVVLNTNQQALNEPITKDVTNENINTWGVVESKWNQNKQIANWE